MVAAAHPRLPEFACDLPGLWNPRCEAFDDVLRSRYKVAARSAALLRWEPVNAGQFRIARRLQMVNV
jgi:hypothetical protein